MAYDNVRSYSDVQIVAQNIVSTASNAVATSTTTGWMPIGEASYVVSIAGVITATPASPPANTTKYAVLLGTTTIGSISPVQAIGSSAFSTFTPVAVQSNTALAIVCIGTGTASSTETAGAINLMVGLAPQYV